MHATTGTHPHPRTHRRASHKNTGTALTPVAALKLDLPIHCMPAGVLQLRCEGDGRALVGRQALVSPEQPNEATALLNLQETNNAQGRRTGARTSARRQQLRAEARLGVWLLLLAVGPARQALSLALSAA